MKKYSRPILLVLIFLPLISHAGIGDILSGTFDVVGTVLAPLGYLLMKIMSLFTALGAIVLNASIYYTVVQMAETFTNVTAINIAWAVVRDLANMSFIFVLLYAS